MMRRRGSLREKTQLLAILPGPAAATGLTVVGQFNLGDDEHDYRVQDGGLHRDFTIRVFYPAAALVIEIVSPGHESWGKLDFYAAHGGAGAPDRRPAGEDGPVGWGPRAASTGT